MKAFKSIKKYSTLLVAFFMTLALDTVMTFTMTSINTGWTADFPQRFLNRWPIGFAVAFPSSLIMVPSARKIATLLVAV